jgi:hypothetical protein
MEIFDQLKKNFSGICQKIKTIKLQFLKLEEKFRFSFGNFADCRPLPEVSIGI